MDLAELGLSSLGRIEGSVLADLKAVLARLGIAANTDGLELTSQSEAKALIAERGRALFGRPRPGRDTRIMVTLDPVLLEEPELFDDLLRAGMDVARVNCAHDGPREWVTLVQAVREAEARLEAAGAPVGRGCHISMDLGGPKVRTGPVGRGPQRKPAKICVAPGDLFRIYRDPEHRGTEPTRDEPAGIACSCPEALDAVAAGHRVYIDDGKIAAVVTACAAEWVECEVTAASGNGRVRPERGMNFPDSDFSLPALTEEDRATLPFIAEHADAVALSFARNARDIEDLVETLRALGRPDLGVVVKIETKGGLQGLARILMTGLSLPRFGVMIARGDLAVEVGFENLSLVQEDILCLCEAAHIPVIWATQVLESLARSGLPARAEVTDAAMAQRAECVMLNKGPYIAEAVATLDRVLRTEERRHEKKRQILRDFTAQAD